VIFRDGRNDQGCIRNEQGGRDIHTHGRAVFQLAAIKRSAEFRQSPYQLDQPKDEGRGRHECNQVNRGSNI